MKVKLNQVSIIHFPCQPHFFSYGGFDIQMNRIIEQTNIDPIISKRVDLWSKKESFNIAHFWGASDSHKLNIKFCRENGIKVVISGLFPHKIKKNEYKIKLHRKIRKFFRIESVIYDADIITVINSEQAEVVTKYYGYPKSQIRIIPTILDDYLYTQHNSGIDSEKYVLCVGTICSRKNQIFLAQATVELGVKCIFVGNFDSRETLYEKDFLRLQNLNKELIVRVENISIEELSNLYKRCSVVCCISLNETEPASILEGMHFEKPIITSNLPFAKNKKFDGVTLCNQNNVTSIKKGLLNTLKLRGNNKYPFFNSRSQHSERVLDLYKKLYLDLLS